MYSRQATESVNCENSSACLVTKYCPTSTVFRNPASVQISITRFCCQGLSTSSWYFYHKFSCAKSSVEPPLLLSTPLDNGLVDRKSGCPLPANVNIICSAILSHYPCGLSSLIEYHFFSDPGPRNDHCPAPNLFA